MLVLDECEYLVINARRDVAIEFVASRNSDDDVTDPNQNWIQSPTLHSDSHFSGNSEDDVTYFGFPYDDVTTSSPLVVDADWFEEVSVAGFLGQVCRTCSM